MSGNSRDTACIYANKRDILSKTVKKETMMPTTDIWLIVLIGCTIIALFIGLSYPDRHKDQIIEHLNNELKYYKSQVNENH